LKPIEHPYFSSIYDAKVSIFGKKHSKVDESHLEGQRREREN